MMQDYTLNAYRHYLGAIQKSYANILRFDEYFTIDPKPESFCLIRHDVDRKPHNALRMAELEKSVGLKATYFFRTKRHTFISDIIASIASLGHEIGYHYESLSDARGNIQRALADFEDNLSRLRRVASISTIAMHGRPLSAYDNRKIWQSADQHSKLINQYSLLGEVYLDIDYGDIAYISDTGRNWSPTKKNRRDVVESKISLSFSNGQDLLRYLSHHPHPKMVFLIHPERWSENNIEYGIQYIKDKTINIIKSLV